MADLALTVTLLLWATVGVFPEKHSYNGYKLMSVFAKNVAEVKFLVQLEAEYPEIDFWSLTVPQRNITVLVAPGFLQEFKGFIREHGMSSTVLSDDVQSLVDAGSRRAPTAVVQGRGKATGQVIDHYNYHNYTKILDYLSKLSEKYPNRIEVSTLKHATYEGRDVAVVKLSGASGYHEKPAIIVEAGIHAREWISPASTLWVMEKMFRDYTMGEPGDFTKLDNNDWYLIPMLRDYTMGERGAMMMLDKYDWYLIPVTNPDGYEYTHNEERGWRKNRRHFRNGCYGVDLNRNFDVDFGNTAVSTNCYSVIYSGPEPFSEFESTNLRDLFYSLYDEVVAFVSLHSFSQVVIVPWGYTEQVSRPDNHVELDRVTKLMARAMSERHGKNYAHGTATELIGPASGTSEDWTMTAKPGIIAVAVELRPEFWDQTGFLLPPDQIIPTGQELYAGLQVMAEEMTP